MAVGVVAVTAYMHMTRTDAITDYGSDDKRYKWHMHMNKADGSRGSGSVGKVG